MNVVTALLIYLAAAFAIAFILNRILLKFASNLGTRHGEQLVRWSSSSKPSVGGISFYITFLVTILLFFILSADSAGLDQRSTGWILASVVAFILGLSDDAYNTKPWLKFLLQVACGLILAASGTVIQWFEPAWANYALTVFWVIAIMNSINMLDNMDGITTVVSIFILLSCAWIGMDQLALSVTSTMLPVTLIIGCLGALLAFIPFNWNPSRMFMGDTGSQFIGLFLAAVSITYLWNYSTPETGSAAVAHSKQLVLVLWAFAVPISDTTTVVINRLRRGQSPFVGGRDHTTHHLSYLGFSDRQVGWIMLGISALAFTLIASIVTFIPGWNLAYAALFLAGFLTVLIGLYSSTQLKKAREKFHEIGQS